MAGAFYSHTARDYGQDLPVLGFEELTDIPTHGLRAPKDTLFFSDLSYSTNQFALFGEGTFSFTPRFSVTGGLRYYHFSEDKDQILTASSRRTTQARNSCRSPGPLMPTAWRLA